MNRRCTSHANRFALPRSGKNRIERVARLRKRCVPGRQIESQRGACPVSEHLPSHLHQSRRLDVGAARPDRLKAKARLTKKPTDLVCRR